MTFAPSQAAYAFAQGTLDRVSDRREEAPWLREQWLGAGRAIVVRDDGRLLVDNDKQGALRLSTTDPVCRERFDHASFLGVEGDNALFSLRVDDAIAATLSQTHGRFIDLRSAAALLPAAEAGIAAYARALLHWQSRKRFCGRCGAPTQLLAAGHRAHCSDESCGQQYFPRTDPAIIVLVSDGPRCLLGRQPSWPVGRFSTLAGFVEPGETLEQAVAREVFEESGVRADHARYVGAQPWPFPASLMLGFEATAVTRDIHVGAELAEARWWHLDAIPDAVLSGELILSPGLSIAFHLIDRWYHQHTGTHLEPGPAFNAR